MVSLPIGLLYASLQLSLDNRKNENSRNVCLSQIREKIFPLKISTYTVVSKLTLVLILNPWVLTNSNPALYLLVLMVINSLS